MLIITVTRPFVSSILSTSPSKLSKVPSFIFTRSPSRKAIFSRGDFSLFFFLFGDDAGDFVGEHRAGMPGGAGEIADPGRLAHPGTRCRY